MVIRIDVRDPKKNGDWKKPKNLCLPVETLPELPNPADQEILDRLIGTRRDTWYHNSVIDSQFRFHLRQRELNTLLPLIANTGRLYIDSAGNGELLPLVFEDGAPWDFSIDVVEDSPAAPDSHAGRYMAVGAFYRDGVRLAAGRPEFIFAEGFLVFDGKIARFSGSFEWIDFFTREDAFFVPAAEADQWLEAMYNLTPAPPPMRLPENLRFEDVRPIPHPHIEIRSSRERWGISGFEASLHFDYEGMSISDDCAVAFISQASRRRRILRDFKLEEQAREKLFEVGFNIKSAEHGRIVWTISHSDFPAAVRELAAAGWRVEAEGRIMRNPGEFNMRISSGIDWFELHGDVDFGGTRVKLPRLLAALKRREKTIRLDDGSYGIIPEDWLKKYGVISGLGSAEGDYVRFGTHQAGILDALLASRPEVSCDALFERMRVELLNFSGVTPADAPAGFQGELRAYQREGLGWMHFLQKFNLGGCLADDMGLGKTIQALALLEERRSARADTRGEIPPSLVVMPRSLVFNWLREAGRFTPGIRVLEHTGVERIRGHEHFDDYDVIFTTYGTLRHDAAFFQEKTFDYIILDEAQAIKNASTESAKAARLLNGRHRLALSGTPVENHLGELWSLFEFLNPGMLGSASVFRQGKGAVEKLDEETREFLARALRPFILRRTKAQVTRDLPEKVEQTLFCTLEPAQRALYNELRDHYRFALLGRIRSDGLEKSKMHILEALLRLRQAAIHPGLIDPKHEDEPGAKMDMLLDQLREVIKTGHKALVFSQFTSMLALLRRRLNAEKIRYEYLDGKTRDRAAPVEQFQNDPEVKLFLISLKAGGLGLNLTAAEYVFLLDPWWNPAVEAQAIDRTHRIGQKRSVFAYRLIAEDTVEEKVLQLQASKREIAAAVINQDGNVLQNLRAEDLELLLS
jgi:superfamily II DNA or RNA helicase